MDGHGQWNKEKSFSGGIKTGLYMHCNGSYCFCIHIMHQMFIFDRQQKWGLNTYLYAPKDDYKHRMFWREMYSVEEAGDCHIKTFRVV